LKFLIFLFLELTNKEIASIIKINEEKRKERKGKEQKEEINKKQLEDLLQIINVIIEKTSDQKNRRSKMNYKNRIRRLLGLEETKQIQKEKQQQKYKEFLNINWSQYESDKNLLKFSTQKADMKYSEYLMLNNFVSTGNLFENVIITKNSYSKNNKKNIYKDDEFGSITFFKKWVMKTEEEENKNIQNYINRKEQKKK